MTIMLPGFFGQYSSTTWLTILCAIPPVLQTFIVLVVWYRHPTIKAGPNGETVHTLDKTRAEFEKMVRDLLKREFHGDHKHHAKIKEWLVIKTINANNYCKNDKVNSDTEKNDGRLAEKIPFNAEAIVSRVLAENTVPPSHVHVTPMMEIINYHVHIISITSRLEQVNLGMNISESTQLKRDRLPWRGVIDVLRTLEEEPIFPSVLQYSVVRALKETKDWSYADKGTRLDPQSLSEKPWPGLKSKACFYIRSFLFDVWLFWFQIYFSTVVIGIIFNP